MLYYEFGEIQHYYKYKLAPQGVPPFPKLSTSCGLLAHKGYSYGLD